MKNRLVECIATNMRRAWMLSCFCVAAMSSSLAFAGQTCHVREASPQAQQTAFRAAGGLESWLNARGAEVAIIARRGQDIGRYGLTFSHAAFVVRGTDGASWTVIHDLNRCGTAEANLFIQGLAEFYMDDLVSTQTAIVIPAPEVQTALKRLLADNAMRYRMQEPSYSVSAYPFAFQHQNSNGWLLETYVNALANGTLLNREQAQHALMAAGYEPSVVTVDPVTRLGGRLFAANVSFDDQPPALRWKDRITLSSGDSVMKFVARRGISQSGCAHGAFADSVCIVSP